jgi:hypothetical protein
MLALGAVVCVAGAAGLWFAFGRSSQRLIVMTRGVPPITMDRPLWGGEQTTLAGASAKLGATITLPSADVSDLSASNVGAVWVRQDGGGPADEGHSTSVVVTFPSLGVILQLSRPVGYPEPPAQMYRTEASQRPDVMTAIDLNGVPALYTAQKSDQLKQNFGAIQFVSHGTYMAVLGYYDLDTLRGYATAVQSAAAG